jgi:two-component system phosphate regulon response regulator PhoB
MRKGFLCAAKILAGSQVECQESGRRSSGRRAACVRRCTRPHSTHETAPTLDPETTANLFEEEGGAVNTILIVEDNVDGAESMRLFLEYEGFVPLVAVDGEAALQLLRQVRPNAVLVDVLLPGMSGAEFCSVLRAHPNYADLPVVVITALDEWQTREMFECFDAFLRKPIDADQLVTLLRRIVAEPLEPGRPSTRHAWPADRFGAASREFLEYQA